MCKDLSNKINELSILIRAKKAELRDTQREVSKFMSVRGIKDIWRLHKVNHIERETCLSHFIKIKKIMCEISELKSDVTRMCLSAALIKGHNVESYYHLNEYTNLSKIIQIIQTYCPQLQEEKIEQIKTKINEIIDFQIKNFMSNGGPGRR